MVEPFFSAKCNCLFEMANVDTVLPIKSVVRQFGNWVGGTAYCHNDRVVFSVNAVNAKFQKDDSDVVVFYEDMTDAHLGRMMRVFKTVDIITKSGLLRFRCMGKSNDRLLAAISDRIA